MNKNFNIAEAINEALEKHMAEKWVLATESRTGFQITGYDKTVSSEEVINFMKRYNHKLLLRKSYSYYSYFFKEYVLSNGVLAVVASYIKGGSPAKITNDFVLQNNGVVPIGVVFYVENSLGLLEMMEISFNYNGKVYLPGETSIDITNSGYETLDQYMNDFICTDFCHKYALDRWKNHYYKFGHFDSRWSDPRNNFVHNAYFVKIASIVTLENNDLKFDLNFDLTPITKNIVEENKNRKRKLKVTERKQDKKFVDLQNLFNSLPIVSNKLIDDLFASKMFVCKNSNPTKNFVVLVDLLNTKEKTVAVRIFDREYKMVQFYTVSQKSIKYYQIVEMEDGSKAYMPSPKVKAVNDAEIIAIKMDKAEIKDTIFSYVYNIINSHKNNVLFDFVFREILTNNIFEIIFNREETQQYYIDNLEKLTEKYINDKISYNHFSLWQFLPSRIRGLFINPYDLGGRKSIKRFQQKDVFAFDKNKLNIIFKIQKELDFKYGKKVDVSDLFWGFYSDWSKTTDWVNYYKDLDINSFEKLLTIAVKTYEISINKIKESNCEQFDNENPVKIHDFLWYLINKQVTINDVEYFLIILNEYLADKPKMYNYNTLQKVKDSLEMINSIKEQTDLKIPRVRKGMTNFNDIEQWHDDLIEISNHFNVRQNRYLLRRNNSNITNVKDFNNRLETFKKLEFENDKFVIKYPENPKDLIEEGYALNHCVGSYINRVANGETTILFIREKENVEKAYFTMEVTNNKIRQVHGMCNSNVVKNSDLDLFISSFCKDKKIKKENIHYMYA